MTGEWWRWTLLNPDGVAPSRMVSVSASVNLPLHHKVHRFSSGKAHPGGPGKRAVKWLCGGMTIPWETRKNRMNQLLVYANCSWHNEYSDIQNKANSHVKSFYADAKMPKKNHSLSPFVSSLCFPCNFLEAIIHSGIINTPYSPTNLCDGAQMAIFCILYF